MTILALDARQIRDRIDELCVILADCVEGGASVGFMSPFTPADALPFWQGIADQAAAGTLLVFAAEEQGRLVGTVQVGFATKPNQPHRGDLMKLLVLRSLRGKGLARALMEAAEAAALAHGRRVLVLDTATGSPAESLYPRLGWQRVGVVPDFALFPDGSYCGTTFFYKHLS